MDKVNPHLEIPNPYDEYKKSIGENFNKESPLNKAAFECLVNSKEGAHFYEILEQTFLLSGQMFDPRMENARDVSFYWMAIREFVIFLKASGMAYKKTIQS